MKQADKFRLCVSGLTGTVYIASVSKKQPYLMNENRRAVPLPELYEAIIEHVDALIKEGDDTLSITADDKVVAEIKIFRENF